MKRLTVLLGLSAALSACGPQPSSTESAGTGGLPSPSVALFPALITGDVQPMFQNHTAPRPFPGMVPIDPVRLRPALPDRPEPTPLAPQSTAPLKTVRVYYSDPLPASSPYRDGGSFHALMLRNLLGQYDNVQVISRPISQYVAGEAGQTLRTFYIGTVFDESLPSAFLDDVKAGAAVTWIGYNLWKLGSGQATLGLTHRMLHTATTPEQIAAAYSTVEYKGYAYHKYPAPQELDEISADPSKTEVLATASDSAGDNLPYLTRSGQFYYVADNPFQYIYPTDRYLVLADSLHRMLGDTTAASTCKKQAILRLEDISAINDPKTMQDTLDVIQSLNIPFAMTVIPESWYDGVKYPWTGNGAQLLQVYRAVSMGGVVIQHGYTHNYHGLKVPEGNSGEEWEFWDKEGNHALPALTPAVASARIAAGRRILLGLGLQPRLWTTPHYEADPELYPAISAAYPRVIERRIYTADGVRAGQFFPYPVRDVSGTLVVPENLGNIQPGYLSDAILQAADANRNLDCAYASFFVHPYLLQAGYTGSDALTKQMLKKLLTDIQARGYTFVSPLDVGLRTLP